MQVILKGSAEVCEGCGSFIRHCAACDKRVCDTTGQFSRKHDDYFCDDCSGTEKVCESAADVFANQIEAAEGLVSQ